MPFGRMIDRTVGGRVHEKDADDVSLQERFAVVFSGRHVSESRTYQDGGMRAA